MRHYHGTPMGGTRIGVEQILRRRHALVPYLRSEDLPIALEVCIGVAIDNGAYTAWKRGTPIEDWSPYAELIDGLQYHPRFDFALIPDVVDGSENQNDELIEWWMKKRLDLCRKANRPRRGVDVPVWHLHESLERLRRLAFNWSMIAFGSSGQFSVPGSESWKSRMSEAMDAVCGKDGRPITRVHGLRMLSQEIVSRYPFFSCDSTNVAQNKSRPWPVYDQPSDTQKASCIAARIEATQPPSVWVRGEKQMRLISEDEAAT